MHSVWNKDPAALPQPVGTKRVILGGALLDLAALQQEIHQGRLGEDEVWVANPNCDRDLENYQWTYSDVLQMLICLDSDDYSKSEWCQVSGGTFYPCDVYKLCYDSDRRARNARGLEVYLKFSVDDSGLLTLVLVSCHGSR